MEAVVKVPHVRILQNKKYTKYALSLNHGFYIVSVIDIDRHLYSLFVSTHDLQNMAFDTYIDTDALSSPTSNVTPSLYSHIVLDCMV